MFTRGSRYAPIGEREYHMADGRVIRHKRIRFIPAPSNAEPGPQPTAVAVQEAERPDLLAWRIAQDPEAYWRLCDANGIARPCDLTARPGRVVLVPQPAAEG